MKKSSTDSFSKEPSGENDLPEHSECLKILNLVLDEEATEEQRTYFKTHLENCMPYFEIYNVDLKIKELIRKKCCDKKVPKDLVNSIKEQILLQAE